MVSKNKIGTKSAQEELHVGNLRVEGKGGKDEEKNLKKPTGNQRWAILERKIMLRASPIGKKYGKG